MHQTHFMYFPSRWKLKMGNRRFFSRQTAPGWLLSRVKAHILSRPILVWLADLSLYTIASRHSLCDLGGKINLYEQHSSLVRLFARPNKIKTWSVAESTFEESSDSLDFLLLLFLAWLWLCPTQVKCSVRGDLGPACNAAGMIDRYIIGNNHLYAKPVYRNLKVSACWCCFVE